MPGGAREGTHPVHHPPHWGRHSDAPGPAAGPGGGGCALRRARGARGPHAPPGGRTSHGPPAHDTYPHGVGGAGARAPHHTVRDVLLGGGQGIGPPAARPASIPQARGLVPRLLCTSHGVGAPTDERTRGGATRGRRPHGRGDGGRGTPAPGHAPAPTGGTTASDSAKAEGRPAAVESNTRNREHVRGGTAEHAHAGVHGRGDSAQAVGGDGGSAGRGKILRPPDGATPRLVRAGPRGAGPTAPPLGETAGGEG